jgi:putative tricarboxylic transport membrane protein
MKKILCAVLALATSAAALAAAAWVPSRNVEIVAGVSAGGSMDRTARVIENIIRVRKLVPTSITVVNKPGGGQALGLHYVKSHQGDAHYISVNSEPLLTNHISGRSPISYKDFTPLAGLFQEYVAFSVRKDSDIKNLKDLIARLKSKPDSLSIAIGTAFGNVNHVALASLMDKFNGDVKRVRVPIFSSMGECITALLGGHVDALVSVVSAVKGFVPSGQIRVLAVTAPKRLPGVLNGIPTLTEVGYDVQTASFRVLLAPPNISAAQVRFWNHVFESMVKTSAWSKALEANLWIPKYRNSAQTRMFLDKENETLAKIYVRLGLAH